VIVDATEERISPQADDAEDNDGDEHIDIIFLIL